jgi:hypothetical protein
VVVAPGADRLEAAQFWGDPLAAGTIIEID